MSQIWQELQCHRFDKSFNVTKFFRASMSPDYIRASILFTHWGLLPPPPSPTLWSKAICQLFLFSFEQLLPLEEKLTKVKSSFLPNSTLPLPLPLPLPLQVWSAMLLWLPLPLLCSPCGCWSLLMQETLLLWGLFLVDEVGQLEEVRGVVWGGVVVGGVKVGGVEVGWEVVGGEVEKVARGCKPKLAGPHTWDRLTLGNVSNGFKSLRPLQQLKVLELKSWKFETSSTVRHLLLLGRDAMIPL